MRREGREERKEEVREEGMKNESGVGSDEERGRRIAGGEIEKKEIRFTQRERGGETPQQKMVNVWALGTCVRGEGGHKRCHTATTDYTNTAATPPLSGTLHICRGQYHHLYYFCCLCNLKTTAATSHTAATPTP